MTSFAQALVDVAPSTPYTSHYIAEIENNRRALEGKLFFDKLLSELVSLDSVTPGLYPPKDKETTLLLLQQIEAAECPNRLNQACLIYYIFLDYPEDISIAEYYSEELDLPLGHQALIAGFWHIDHLNFERGLVKLGHPAALPTFSDDLIAVLFSGLVHQASQVESARQVLAYVTSKVPPLQTSETLERLVSALCLSSAALLRGLKFARSVSPEVSTEALRALTVHALKNNQTARLTNLPFTTREQKSLAEIVMSIIQEGDAEIAPLAKDALLMRYLNGVHDFPKALKLSDLGNTKRSADSANSFVSWNDIAKGLRKSNIEAI